MRFDPTEDYYTTTQIHIQPVRGRVGSASLLSALGVEGFPPQKHIAGDFRIPLPGLGKQVVVQPRRKKGRRSLAQFHLFTVDKHPCFGTMSDVFNTEGLYHTGLLHPKVRNAIVEEFNLGKDTDPNDWKIMEPVWYETMRRLNDLGRLTFHGWPYILFAPVTEPDPKDECLINTSLLTEPDPKTHDIQL